ncbi:MAG TPA: DEAD/DEAH box helicase family protein, partial [Candidatus Krumholzibacteria bacterium]
MEPERPRGPEADAGERPGEAREAEVGKPAADDGKGAAAERGGKFGESNTVFSSERADAALEKLKKLLGPKTDPDEPVKFFAFGLDPEVIGPLADYAGYIIEGALRKTGRVLYSEFGQRMHKLLDQMLPEESQGTARDYAPYFGPLWDALRARPELAKYALPPAPVWKVPDRKGPNVWRELMEIEAENERKVREEDPDAADTSGKDQLTIDEQLRAKRDEEVDIALNGSRDPILEDQYQGEFPWAHDQVMHDPAFGELLDSHQKPAAKAIVRTLEAGSDFLLADGAGTGKTWTALAAALEMTTRHGGKVVVFTGTRTAIGQWTRKEFPLMGVDPETQVRRVEQIGDEGTRVAIDIKSTFQANLAHRLDPLKALIEKGVPGDPVEGETRPAGLNREVPVILVDEAHFAGTWHKAESKEHRARRFVAFTDWARERGVRMLYTTATPADEAPQLRYLSGLFTPKGTDLEFDNFMQTIGFNKSPHGKKRYEIDPRRSHEVTANLLLLRRKLALEGKMLNREMSYDGVETMFGRHELTPAEWGEWDATIDKYALLEDQLTRSGFGAVAGLVPAWRIGDQRRKSEAWKMADAVKWASSFREATDGNGRVIILTDYVNPAKVDKVHGMLSRPRTADGASALSRIAELYGPERAFEVEQMAKRLDFDS